VEIRTTLNETYSPRPDNFPLIVAPTSTIVASVLPIPSHDIPYNRTLFPFSSVNSMPFSENNADRAGKGFYLNTFFSIKF